MAAGVAGSLDAVADSCFFVDLFFGRPEVRGWIATNPSVILHASVVTLGELAMGQAERIKVQERLRGVSLLPIDEEVAWLFGHLGRTLRSQGQMVGVNDLWIASIAVRSGLPVVTRNVSEFARVPGLQVFGY